MFAEKRRFQVHSEDGRELTLPMWMVVDLDTLLKCGLPAAFVRSGEWTTVAFNSKSLAEEFIRRSARATNYVPHLVGTPHALQWLVLALARDGLTYLRLDVGKSDSELLSIADLLKSSCPVD
jgi:hypothetical protein